MTKPSRYNALLNAMDRASNRAVNVAFDIVFVPLEALLKGIVWAATAPFIRKSQYLAPYDTDWEPFLEACKEGLPERLRGDFEHGIARGYHLAAHRKDNFGYPQTALELAIDSGSLAAVAALVQAGAPLERADVKGRAALARASARGFDEICSFLIAKGARINPGQGKDPLCAAAKGGHPQTTRLLLAAGSRPRKAASFNGFGALSYACRGEPIAPGNIDCMKILLEAGADPLESRDDKTTALMWACDDGNLEAIELLLAAGADPFVRRDDGADALMWSMRNVSRDPKAAMAIAALAKPNRKPRKDGRDDLMFAAQGGMPECVAWALARGCDPAASDKEGHTALHHAASSGSRLAVEALLAAGASAQALNLAGASPMAIASFQIDPGAFEALALAGADPLFHPSAKTSSPLANACERGWLEAIEICLRKGLKQRFKDGEGESICAIAEQAHPQAGARVRAYWTSLAEKDLLSAEIAEAATGSSRERRRL